MLWSRGIRVPIEELGALVVIFNMFIQVGGIVWEVGRIEYLWVSYRSMRTLSALNVISIFIYQMLRNPSSSPKIYC